MDYLEVHWEKPSTQSAMLPEMGSNDSNCVWFGRQKMDILTQRQERWDELMPAGHVVRFSPVGLYFISYYCQSKDILGILNFHTLENLPDAELCVANQSSLKKSSPPTSPAHGIIFFVHNFEDTETLKT